MLRFLSLNRNLFSRSVPQILKTKNVQKRYFTPDILEMTGLTPNQLIGLTGAMSALASTGWLATRYRVATSNQYIVRTGILIDDIDISKKAFQLPFQTASVINMDPGTYHSLIEAMSKEKIAFKMPTVFTIGPKDEESYLTKYAKLLNQSSYEEIKQTINGVVQGEGRILAAGLPLEELFNSRHHFKTEVTDKINEELSKFGLVVYNANIEELSDMEGNEYFSYLRKRALEGAINKARVDVAEQKRFGDTGEKEHEGETRQTVSQIEMDAKLVENQRQKDVSESNTILSVAQAEYKRQIKIAEAESDAAAQKKMFELQSSVEETRRRQETEKRRANELTAAEVQAEVDIMYADGKARALRIESDAKLYSEQQKASGIFAQREAEAQGLSKLVESAGGVDKLTQYLLIHNEVLPKLAKEQANALQGLNPDIHVWQTGNSNDGVKDLSGTITDMFKTGMPLFDGIKKQTGVDFLKTFQDTEDSSTKKKVYRKSYSQAVPTTECV